MQTKRLTILEVACNVGIGIIGSWLISVYVISHVVSPIEAATIITAACTVWSIVRGYFIRRAFNRLAKRPY